MPAAGGSRGSAGFGSLQLLADQLLQLPAYLFVIDAVDFSGIQLPLHLVQLVLELRVGSVDLGDLFVERVAARVRGHGGYGTPAFEATPS